MPSPTYIAIAKTVLSSSQRTITFSSIPSTYTDLLLSCSSKSDYSSTTMVIRININSSSSNLTSRLIDSYGSGQYTTTDTTWIYSTTGSGTSTLTNAFGNAEIYIPNYAGSNKKPITVTYASELNESGTSLGVLASLFNSTSAITTISLTPDNASANFASGSRFDLYGIKNS